MKVIAAIRSKIKRLPQGEPFVSSQFFRLGQPTAVRKHLSDLAKQGAIRRAARGVYILAKEEASASVSAEQVASAVAKAGKYRAFLVAAHLEESIFLTDGPSRRIQMKSHMIVKQD